MDVGTRGFKQERKTASESQIASNQHLISIQEKTPQRNKILSWKNGDGNDYDHLLGTS